MHPLTARQPKFALIVEDDPFMAQMVKCQLEAPTGEEGGDTHTACCVNGQWIATKADSLGEAAALLRQNEFDVVLLDMILGDGEKEDAVTIIREAAPDTCIVVQSGLTDADLVRRLLLSGKVSDYIVKGDVNTPIALKQRLCHAIDVFNVSRDVDLELELSARGQSGLD